MDFERSSNSVDKVNSATLSGLLKQLAKYQVPRDEDDPHYIQSFEVDDQDNIKEFFNTYGFVVVRNVLTEQDCQNTIDEIYGFLEAEGKFKRNDMSTWDFWPKDGMEKHGMPVRSPVFTKQVLKNRINPKVYQTFSTILGVQDLLVSHDRLGFLRPTIDVVINGKIVDKTKWKTASNIHMDVNPWGYFLGDGSQVAEALAGLTYGYNHLNHFIFENNQISNAIHPITHLQGVINLADNYEEDGGFLVVPGFKNHFSDWLKLYEKSDLAAISSERNSVPFSDKDPLQPYAIRVPMRAGSLVVWDQRSPHGARCNNSSRIRCAQFIKMFPAQPMDPKRAIARSSTLLQVIKKADFMSEMTPLAQRLFGLAKADEEPAQPVNVNINKEPDNKDKEEKKEFKKKSRVQGGWSAKN